MVLHLLKLIRWPNLLIVFITQFIVWFQLIGETLQSQNLNSSLSFFQLLALSICTILIAAAGYVINDIEDIRIDLINKPEKVIVGKHIMKKTCTSFYYLLLSIGFVIALGLAWQLDKLPYVLLYPVAAATLHVYATHLKKSTLLGNIVISLFVAFVPLLVFLADAHQFSMTQHPRLYLILLLYSSLAFLSNLAREVAKDMQDLKGDKVYGAKTFPIRFGFKATKYLIHFILILILTILVYWTFSFDYALQTFNSISLGSAPLLFTTIGLMAFLVKIESAQEIGKWSLGIKIFMLFGLIFLYLQPL